jgi:ribosomal-protein-alanine N-acetyltransferase
MTRDESPVAAPAPRISLRAAQPGDVRFLAEAESLCFPDPWPAQYFVSEMLAGGRFQRVMTDASGRLVAYLFTAWQYLDLHVLKVATLPGFRRLGLARRLMEVAEQHCAESGGETITLEVRPSNDDAIALYEALGYKRIGRRPRYYANGEDALVMTKQIGA